VEVTCLAHGRKKGGEKKKKEKSYLKKPIQLDQEKGKGRGDLAFSLKNGVQGKNGKEDRVSSPPGKKRERPGSPGGPARVGMKKKREKGKNGRIYSTLTRKTLEEGGDVQKSVTGGTDKKKRWSKKRAGKKKNENSRNRSTRGGNPTGPSP